MKPFSTILFLTLFEMSKMKVNGYIDSWKLCWEDQQCGVENDRCCWATPDIKETKKSKVMLCGPENAV